MRGIVDFIVEILIIISIAVSLEFVYNYFKLPRDFIVSVGFVAIATGLLNLFKGE
jgi:thiamine transporter ThiT